MMKQWLIRLAVRIPVSRATTAAISSSVWRLPFMSASARPSRTRATARAAASWLCAASISGNAEMSIPAFSAAALTLPDGPTRIGSISLMRAASMADWSDTSSHGCAIAVGTAGNSRAAATTRSYFSWWRSGCIFVFPADLVRCRSSARGTCYSLTSNSLSIWFSRRRLSFGKAPRAVTMRRTRSSIAMRCARSGGSSFGSAATASS